MIENDFTKLEFIDSIVVEVKKHTLCLSVQFWEGDRVPLLKGSPVKVSLTNLSPATSKGVEHANLDMSWMTLWMGASILESYALET